MASNCLGNGISFLYQFDLGNKNINNPGQNIISISSTATGDFDKANLLTDSTRQRWRSAEILTMQEIIIKAEIKSQIDTFAILGHNLTEEALIRIEANIDNNFVAPPESHIIPWKKENLLWLSEFTGEYEYYRITILDPTNLCGYIELGRIIGGRAFTFSLGEDITDTFTVGKTDYSDKMRTEGFSTASNQRVKARSLRASFSKLDSKESNNTNWQGLRDLFDYVGITVPLLLIADRESPDLFAAWGKFQSIPDENFMVNLYVNESFRFNEEF